MLISNTNRGRYSGCAQESDNDKNNGMYKPRCNRTLNLWNKKFGPQPYKNHLLHVHADDFLVGGFHQDVRNPECVRNTNDTHAVGPGRDRGNFF